MLKEQNNELALTDSLHDHAGVIQYWENYAILITSKFRIYWQKMKKWKD